MNTNNILKKFLLLISIQFIYFFTSLVYIYIILLRLVFFMKYIRKIYDWVLHWAETPYGPLALFLLAFAESSFFPIPPDALLIALALGARSKSFKFAAICTIASVLGALLGYAIGYFVWWEGVNEFSSCCQLFLC